MIRIVDPETRVECPARTVGEIWVHGENVATGYCRKRRLDVIGRVITPIHDQKVLDAGR
jgi:acyl-CoA synthetase (AMP-forming)/AMP-acid ligase II